jgi:hypothetical protein
MDEIDRLEQRADQLEQRNEQLAEHIDDAKAKADEQRVEQLDPQAHGAIGNMDADGGSPPPEVSYTDKRAGEDE